MFGDFLGRMVRVDEKLAPDVFATTFYEYDGNDNVRRIQDADNVVTTMEHDLLSRRTRVERGGRAWTYAYDRNDNLIAETPPNPNSETADAPLQYTTITIYDALDRPDSRVLGVRDLSDLPVDNQLDDFDAAFVDYTYDCLGNLGRLCVEDSGSNLKKTYIYDFAGRVIEEKQLVSLPRSVVDFGAGSNDRLFLPERTAYADYNLAGAITDAWLADGPDKDSSTHVSYTYNGVGGAQDTEVYHDPSGDETLNVTTTVERSKAQRITLQETGCLSRTWDYDHKGRVTDTSVFATGCATQGGQ